MGRRKRNQTQQDAVRAAEQTSQRALLKAVAIPAAIAAVAILVLKLLHGDPQVRVSDQESSAAPIATTAPLANEAAKSIVEGKSEVASLESLKGKWYRQDGDYLLEIKSIDAQGQLAATYFNPRPIFVSKARASQENGQFEVFVELRDEGYPGCTYNLKYDPADQQLEGIYFQAAQQQSYPVVFTRNREP